MAPQPKHLSDYLTLVKVVGPWCCWKLPNKPDHEGYVRLNLLGKKYRAHRVIYDYLIKPIPRTKVPDHLCQHTWCCNPDHIEPVTQRVNILRGCGVAAINARKTKCRRGHPLTRKNMFFNKHGYRICRTCSIRKQREWRRRNLNQGS